MSGCSWPVWQLLAGAQKPIFRGLLRRRVCSFVAPSFSSFGPLQCFSSSPPRAFKTLQQGLDTGFTLWMGAMKQPKHLQYFGSEALIRGSRSSFHCPYDLCILAMLQDAVNIADIAAARHRQSLNRPQSMLQHIKGKVSRQRKPSIKFQAQLEPLQTDCGLQLLL